MISELSFLIDLLLNHDLKKETKDVVAARIKDVEAEIQKKSLNLSTNFSGMVNCSSPQPDPYIRVQKQIAGPVSLPPEQVAQTPATQAAIAHREAIMHGAKPDMVSTGVGTKGPKKW